MSIEIDNLMKQGPKTCAGRPAAQGYEILDAETYANWTVDYLKEVRLLNGEGLSSRKH